MSERFPIDYIRGVVAYATAAIAFLLGVVALVLFIAFRIIPAEVGLPALVGLVGAPATFLFAAEVAKQASKQTARDILQQPPPQDPPPPAA